MAAIVGHYNNTVYILQIVRKNCKNKIGLQEKKK